jgi:hypothetical protein
MILAAECVKASCSTWGRYAGLMTDAPHLAAEATIEVVTTLFAIVVGRPFLRRAVRRHDQTHHDA